MPNYAHVKNSYKLSSLIFLLLMIKNANQLPGSFLVLRGLHVVGGRSYNNVLVKLSIHALVERFFNCDIEVVFFLNFFCGFNFQI